MRQIGVIENEPEARRFTAYLVTEGIVAHFEPEDVGWAVWVRDENDVDQAREAMDAFQRDPDANEYQGVEREAISIMRREAQHREKAAKNVVDIRTRWANPGAVTARRAPLLFVLIGLSVLATILTNWGQNNTANELSFVSFPTWQRESAQSSHVEAAFANIAQGQLWRLITPIFIHLQVLHLVFNLYCLYYFGGQIESRKGTWFLGLQVLLLAVISNIAQAVISTPFGFGMSGVVYGLFGYVWMKSRFDPASGLSVSQLNVLILVGWFFLCMTGIVGNIANTAHGAGLATGVVLGYAPILFRPRPRS